MGLIKSFPFIFTSALATVMNSVTAVNSGSVDYMMFGSYQSVGDTFSLIIVPCLGLLLVALPRSINQSINQYVY